MSMRKNGVKGLSAEWVLNIPLIITFENNWLFSGAPAELAEGRAFIVEPGASRALFEKHIVMAGSESDFSKIGRSIGEELRNKMEFFLSASGPPPSEGPASRTIGWEWRFPPEAPRGASPVMAAFRVANIPPSQTDALLGFLQTPRFVELPCDFSPGSFIGANLSGWLCAIAAQTERERLLAGETIANGIDGRRSPRV